MSNPFHRQEEAAPISDVNVVPLADVSLVLLIILLVLSPMTTQSMLKVQTKTKEKPTPIEVASLPEVKELKEPELILNLSLTNEGYIYNGRLISTDAEIKSLMTTTLSQREDKKIFLTPDLEVTNGRIVKAIETLQSCGASAVALVQVIETEQPL